MDIILTNNGYKVFNLGIKQPIENMIAEFQKQDADAIGMSGLLVKSTVIMKEDLVTLNERKLVSTGHPRWRRLNRRYVEEDLRAIYRGQLFYGEDAFAGLRIMDGLAARKNLERVGSSAIKGAIRGGRQIGGGSSPPVASKPIGSARHPEKRPRNPLLPNRSPSLPKAPDVPVPPFLGSRTRTDFDVRELFKFVNELTLFSTQWGFKKGGVKPADYEMQMSRVARPALERLKALCLEENILRPAVAYGFFPASSDGTRMTTYADDHVTPRDV